MTLLGTVLLFCDDIPIDQHLGAVFVCCLCQMFHSAAAAYDVLFGYVCMHICVVEAPYRMSMNVFVWTVCVSVFVLCGLFVVVFLVW